MSSRFILAQGITVIARDDEVFVEFRDEAGKVFSVAGLTLEAATQFNERVTDVCVEALNARRQAMAAAPKSGVLH